MKQLSDTTWVLEGPTNIGFIEKNHDVILIDSGNDKESGRRINKILSEKNWLLKAIINTHSNADHIGGNDYLQRKFNCEIYAATVEKSFIEYPRLEAAFLWGGFEVKELRNKFFHAKPSTVTKVVEENDVLENGIKIISLKGHFMNMIGIKSPDRVIFLGDCIFGREIINKYKIPFIYDVKEFKKTITGIQDLEADYYIPSHGIIEKDIHEIANYNLEIVEIIENKILEILVKEKNFDNILKEICDYFEISLDPVQYALIGSTIRSFLSYLYDLEKINFTFIENIMLWKQNPI